MTVALPRSRWLAASLAAHGLALALVAQAPRPAALAPVLVPLAPAEFTFAAAPPPPPTVAAAPPPTVTAPPPPPTVAPRRVRVAAPAPTPAPAPTVAPAPAPVVAPAPAPVAAPPALRAADVLRASAALAPSLALAAPATDTRVGPARPALFAGTGDTPGGELARARAATQGYVQQTLAASTAREAPGVRAYLWSVRRRVSEAWRPGVVRVPNLGETLLAGFIPPERALRIFGERFMRRQREALAATTRTEGAADAIEAIGGIAGNGPSRRQNVPIDAGQESWRRNVRTTRAEVEVDQDPAGRVIDVRVLRSSGMATFDRAAVEAVRAGVQDEDPVPLPGGRRSRWSFEVVASRDPIIPAVGFAFDESSGWFELHYPGRLHLRSRVWLEGASPLGG